MRSNPLFADEVGIPLKSVVAAYNSCQEFEEPVKEGPTVESANSAKTSAIRAGVEFGVNIKVDQ